MAPLHQRNSAGTRAAGFPRPLLAASLLIPLAGALALAVSVAPAAAHPPMPGCGMMGGMGSGMGAGMGAGAPATINVQGEGRASVAPDMATVSLGVTTQAATAAQAMADNASRQAAVIAQLRSQGIAPEDMQTEGLNLSPMMDYSRDGEPPVITGYQARNIVIVRVRELDRLGGLLDSLVTAGATDIQGIGFSREDASATEDMARTAAVTEARRRAEVIAAAAGMVVGPLQSLTDMSRGEGPRPMEMMARAADASATTPIEAGQLTLTATVTGVWTLLPAGPGAACGHMGMPGTPGGMAFPQGQPQGMHDPHHGHPHGYHHGYHPGYGGAGHPGMMPRGTGGGRPDPQGRPGPGYSQDLRQGTVPTPQDRGMAPQPPASAMPPALPQAADGAASGGSAAAPPGGAAAPAPSPAQPNQPAPVADPSDAAGGAAGPGDATAPDAGAPAATSD